MRVLPILLLSIALALAGCAKKDDGGGATTTTPTTTTTATSTTTTTTPTGTTTPTTTTPTTPTKPAPQEIATGTADFSNPTAAPAAKAYTIPAGYTMGNLTVTWSCASGLPECPTQEVTVKTAGLTCTLGSGAYGTTTAFAPCVKEGSVSAGEQKVEFTGSGAIMATYKLTIS